MHGSGHGFDGHVHLIEPAGYRAAHAPTVTQFQRLLGSCCDILGRWLGSLPFALEQPICQMDLVFANPLDHGTRLHDLQQPGLLIPQIPHHIHWCL